MMARYPIDGIIDEFWYVLIVQDDDVLHDWKYRDCSCLTDECETWASVHWALLLLVVYIIVTDVLSTVLTVRVKYSNLTICNAWAMMAFTITIGRNKKQR